MITNHRVLQFYNPNLPTKITIDGSKHGFEPTREQKMENCYFICHMYKDFYRTKLVL